MPSETFLNLPKEKKERLLEAAKIEFTAHLLEDASINQIIKNAGISRGSFYQYFEDKEDLYIYLIGQYHEEMHTTILEKVIQNNGDFVVAIEQLYNEILSYCEDGTQHQFFKQMFLNMRYRMEERRNHEHHHSPRKEWIHKVYEHIDKDLFRFTSEEEFTEAFNIVMMITNMSLVATFIKDISERETEKYQMSLHIIKYGLYKKEEENK